jgi:1,2-diacylglycerol 3-alpha-glucosyltransferase
VISNGTDLKRFAPHQAIPGEGRALREKYGLHPDLPVIIHVGRIDVEKQVDLVIRAAAGAMQFVDAQLLVVGDGRRRAALVQLSDRLRIRGRSCFPGFVPPEGDLAGLYRLASVFVTGSEMETQGLVLLEAAATRLPVVGFRATAIPEVVKDGRTGYLVLPRDVPAMTDRIVTLLQNPEQARAMGQAGRALALDHSIEKTMDKHARLYHTLATETAAVEHRLVRQSRDSAQIY